MKTNPFKVTDKVRLRADVLERHSRTVPARTPEQFRWRETLNKLADKTGTITRIFEGSKVWQHVNVDFRWEENGFPAGTVIGIDWTELEGI